MLISEQAKDLVKNCVEGGGCMSPFQPLVYIEDLLINRLSVGREKFHVSVNFQVYDFYQ